MQTDRTFRRIFGALKRRVLSTVRWWPVATVSAVVALIIAHKIYPPIVEWIGERLGVEEPILAVVVALLLVAVFVLERVVDLKEHVKPSITLDDNREDAYESLAQRLHDRHTSKVDLLQFSGQTARGVLRAIKETSPKAKVRMLVADAAMADTFDTDGTVKHTERIRTMSDHIHLWEEEDPDFNVNIKSYDTPASISAVILDDQVICLSWYHVFRERGILRIRGHRSPTITLDGDAARPFVEFGKNEFTHLWGPD